VAALDTPTTRPVAAADPLLDRPLARGPQVQVILVELAEQRPRVELQARLQLAVIKPGRLHALKPADPFLKQLPRPAESITAAICNRGCTPDPRLTIGQDFTPRRVNSSARVSRSAVIAATSVVVEGHQHADLRHPSYVSSPVPNPPITPAARQNPANTASHQKPGCPSRRATPFPFNRSGAT